MIQIKKINNELVVHMMNKSIIKHTIQSVEHVHSDYYFYLFQQLDSLNLSNSESWDKLLQLLEWNQKNNFLQCKQIQKLWIKLIKKYKYKFSLWEELNSSCNFHAYLIDESGHGLQSLIRFYHDRNLIQWKIHAFEFGLNKLLLEQQYTDLEIYFLTQVICEPWAKNYQLSEVFNSYFSNPKHPKTKALYDAFTSYQLKSDTGIKLYEYLTEYNPNYKINSKSTPSFYKELYEQLFHNTK